MTQFSTPICVTDVYPFLLSSVVSAWLMCCNFLCLRMHATIRDCEGNVIWWSSRACQIKLRRSIPNREAKSRSSRFFRHLNNYLPMRAGMSIYWIWVARLFGFNNCRRQYGLSNQFRSWPSVLALWAFWALFHIWTLSPVLLILRVYFVAFIF